MVGRGRRLDTNTYHYFGPISARRGVPSDPAASPQAMLSVIYTIENDSVIQEKLSGSNSFHLFHLEPHELLWQPPNHPEPIVFRESSTRHLLSLMSIENYKIHLENQDVIFRVVDCLDVLVRCHTSYSIAMPNYTALYVFWE